MENEKIRDGVRWPHNGLTANGRPCLPTVTGLSGGSQFRYVNPADVLGTGRQETVVNVVPELGTTVLIVATLVGV
jgi:hypothetical protein